MNLSKAKYFSVILLLLSCSENSETVSDKNVVKDTSLSKAEYFFIPRYSTYGGGFNGVEDEYGYQRRTIYVPYSERTYGDWVSPPDSICEYGFFEENMKAQTAEEFIFKLTSNPQHNDSLLQSRILILINNKNTVDTFRIDGRFHLAYKSQIFELDTLIQSEIINKMPAQLKESWVEDIMAR